MTTQKTRLPQILLILLSIALAAGLGWHWYDNNVDRSGWVETETGKSYRDFHGRLVTGWQEIEGSHYHFTQDHAMSTGWLEQDGSTYYLEQDGTRSSGWNDIDGQRYYFDPDGVMVHGWQDVDGKLHYLDSSGTMVTGWLTMDNVTYYLDGTGCLVTGWLDLDGRRYYFAENGVMLTGWQNIDGIRHYLHPDGSAAAGFLELDGQTYYFDGSGAMTTGWVTQGEYSYYFFEDGTMAVGPVQIDGKQHYFSPHGVHIVLVNPWNYLPEDLEVNLIALDNGMRVDETCYDALVQMLADCTAAGNTPYVCSGYRTYWDQQYLLENRTQRYVDQGYTYGQAASLAKQVVAVPNTSEHQLGLAVDIISQENNKLDSSQVNTRTQQWLMAHCWEYGFILRYPEDSTDITGIIYEPWHYRYVGAEVAMELRDLGITLEEYLGAAEH